MTAAKNSKKLGENLFFRVTADPKGIRLLPEDPFQSVKPQKPDFRGHIPVQGKAREARRTFFNVKFCMAGTLQGDFQVCRVGAAYCQCIFLLSTASTYIGKMIPYVRNYFSLGGEL